MDFFHGEFLLGVTRVKQHHHYHATPLWYSDNTRFRMGGVARIMHDYKYKDTTYNTIHHHCGTYNTTHFFINIGSTLYGVAFLYQHHINHTTPFRKHQIHFFTFISRVYTFYGVPLLHQHHNHKQHHYTTSCSKFNPKSSNRTYNFRVTSREG